MFNTLIITRAGDKIMHTYDTLIEACADADWWEQHGHEAYVSQHYLNSFNSNLLA